jgi:hypothetical protein
MDNFFFLSELKKNKTLKDSIEGQDLDPKFNLLHHEMYRNMSDLYREVIEKSFRIISNQF